MRPLSRTDVDRLLDEDVPSGDLTTDLLQIGGLEGRMTFRARSAMTVAGLEAATALLRRCDVDVRPAASSGDTVAGGTLLLEATGSASSLHEAWKVSQTVVEVASGIASATRSLVEAVAAVDPGVRVACTRKTVPGARRLSHAAVRAGGGVVHRSGLSDSILLFAEHRCFLPDQSLADLARRLRWAAPEKTLVVEVGTVEEAEAAVAAGFDVIQLERFTPADIEAVASFAARQPRPPLVAAAGGINPDNAADVVRAGAGLVVTSWPYTARPRDVAVQIRPG